MRSNDAKDVNVVIVAGFTTETSLFIVVRVFEIFFVAFKDNFRYCGDMSHLGSLPILASRASVVFPNLDDHPLLPLARKDLIFLVFADEWRNQLGRGSKSWME